MTSMLWDYNCRPTPIMCVIEISALLFKRHKKAQKRKTENTSAFLTSVKEFPIFGVMWTSLYSLVQYWWYLSHPTAAKKLMEERMAIMPWNAWNSHPSWPNGQVLWQTKIWVKLSARRKILGNRSARETSEQSGLRLGLWSSEASYLPCAG